MNEAEQFEFVKEAAVWGLLYGFQQEKIDFFITYIKDKATKEHETLIFRWHKTNPPTIHEDKITCTLVFNSVPADVCVYFKDILLVSTEAGLEIPFPVYIMTPPEPEEKTRRGLFRVVH